MGSSSREVGRAGAGCRRRARSSALWGPVPGAGSTLSHGRDPAPRGGELVLRRPGPRYSAAMSDAARWDGTDLLLALHVQPGARKTEVAGLHGGALKLRLQARPVEGAANEALLGFLAEAFGLPRRQVVLEAGLQSRQKRVRLLGPARGPAQALLASWGLLSGAE